MNFRNFLFLLSCMSLINMVEAARMPRTKKTPSSSVIEISTMNHFQKERDKAFSQNKPVVLEIYMPSCPHCKQVRPRFEQESQQRTDVVFLAASTDNPKVKELVDRYASNGVPTFVFFKPQQQPVIKSVTYSSVASLDKAINTFLSQENRPSEPLQTTSEGVEKRKPINRNKELIPAQKNTPKRMTHTQPAKHSSETSAKNVTEITSKQQFDDLLAQAKTANKPLVVKLYAVWCGPCKIYKSVFETVARAYKDKALFASVDAEAVPALSHYVAKGYPTTAIFKPNAQEKPIAEASAFSEERLKSFIDKNL